MVIPFNKPYLTGKENEYIHQAVLSGKISGNGMFTKKCHQFFSERWGFEHCLLTTSCTDALEMAAILLNIQPGDEVIAPSFTFVSTVNAFVLRGAKIIFVDSETDTPNIDAGLIEAAISPNTKAIVAVHYAGVACDMDRIKAIAEKHHLYVVEDAAQAIDSSYKGRPLGSIGHLSAFSFHETKNIISGEGGLLVVNDPALFRRAEIIWEKGTNRAAFWRGEVDKYNWVDIGSSYLPSDIIAAFLYAQLENIDTIQSKRCQLWNLYYDKLKPLEDSGLIRLPFIPSYATNNGHMFYIILKSEQERSKLIKRLLEKDIHAVFHYISLHNSPFYQTQHTGPGLEQSDHYSDCLLRLPLYYELGESQLELVVNEIKANWGV